jgi:cell division protein FtsW (lipid II flippase)
MLTPLPARDIPWLWLGTALALTAIGVAFVWSATYAPDAAWGMGPEAVKQVQWWAVALTLMVIVMQVPFAALKELALPLYVAGVMVELAMMAAAGSALVPRIKGQANWLVLGPVSIQPTEFIKLTTLIAVAKLVATPGFEIKRFGHALGALALGAFPAGLIVIGNDTGSALTFAPMTMGILIAAGMRLRHLALLGVAGLAVAFAGVTHLPKDGYQYKRIQAWLHPDEYALTEGYQTMRSVRSIGSGQLTGKGWSQGDQNRLGWLPEKHTDLIYAVVGEESGFIGAGGTLLLFTAFAWLGLLRAAHSRDDSGRNFIVGFVCLLIGQASINLSVAMGVLPVTGVTLPFLSYGGSSLLACYLGLGVAASAGAGRRDG